MLKMLATEEALTLGTTPSCSFDHTSATNDNTMMDRTIIQFIMMTP